MSTLKQLTKDTVIYGVSSILGRIIFVLLTPLYTNTNILSVAENGIYSNLYTLSSFLLVFFGFGLETAFFRFALKEKNNLTRTLATALNSILVTTLALVAICFLFTDQITNLLQVQGYRHLVQFVFLIVAFDTLTSIPFAYLRATNRPIKFAFIKLTGILINVGLNLFFYLYCPKVIAAGSSHPLYGFISSFYNSSFGVGYAFLANVIDSLYKLILLSPTFKFVQKGFKLSLLKKMLNYGWPIMIVLICSMVNEVGDRQLLTWLLPGDAETVRQQLGIYQNNYKFSVFLALFIQAFRYAGEPFFFSKAKENNAKQTYADVLKYFVIFTLFGFLFVSLNLNWLKHILLTSSVYFEGLKIVPILLIAYVFAGAYYNLSIWYKLSDKTLYGAFVAIIGAAVTIVVNLIFIPKYGYIATAWATLACFFVLCLVAYLLGQKHYPVPYQLKTIFIYFALALALYFVFFNIIKTMPEQSILRYGIQFVPLILFAVVVYFSEGNYLRNLLKSN